MSVTVFANAELLLWNARAISSRLAARTPPRGPMGWSPSAGAVDYWANENGVKRESLARVGCDFLGCAQSGGSRLFARLRLQGSD
jgi:hypothetical protein